MNQLSLVAFYGNKDGPLAGLLEHCRSAVAESPLGESFDAYAAAQIHATIVGMECLPGKPPINRNVWAKRGAEVRMNFSPLREVVGQRLPLSIRFGGFEPDDRPFESQGRRPYERSFQIHPTGGRVTLMGWPHAQGDYGPRRLEELREDLSHRCNLEHKYDGDNDLYLVLGFVNPATVTAGAESAVESEVRDYLRHHPLDVSLGLSDVSIACYVDETLDRSTTIARALTDPEVTPDFLEALYAT